MKRLIGACMIGLMVLACGQMVYAGGHRGYSRGYNRGHQGGGHGSWNSWDTFGAVCAGVLGAGLIAAAFSDCNQPAAPVYVYQAPPPPPPPPVYVYQPPPPPPPPPVYPRPLYYVPVYR